MKRFAIAMLMLVGGAGLVAGDGAERGVPLPTDPRFEFLKQLEGRWVAETGLDGKPGSLFEFRVTAGGHAVEETEMIGTPMEMVTLYHMNGDELVATHYCAMGNQPRLKAASKVVDDSLTFDCAGTPGNARSHDEEHVHGWTMRLDGKDRMIYDAELVLAGKVTEAPATILVRQQETASR